MGVDDSAFDGTVVYDITATTTSADVTYDGMTLVISFENRDNEQLGLVVTQDGKPVGNEGKSVDETGAQTFLQVLAGSAAAVCVTAAYDLCLFTSFRLFASSPLHARLFIQVKLATAPGADVTLHSTSRCGLYT